MYWQTADMITELHRTHAVWWSPQPAAITVTETRLKSVRWGDSTSRVVFLACMWICCSCSCSDDESQIPVHFKMRFNNFRRFDPTTMLLRGPRLSQICIGCRRWCVRHQYVAVPEGKARLWASFLSQWRYSYYLLLVTCCRLAEKFDEL